MARYDETYGPIQLKSTLGWLGWQLERALNEGLVPPPDFGGRRWTKPVVDGLLARNDELLAQLGTVPDCGATTAAQVLAERFGGDPEPDAVAELARQGRIREAGDFKGYVLYSGRDLERFTDQVAYQRAVVDGRQRTREQAAAFLRVRVVDVKHLERSGRLRPVAAVLGRWGMNVALFRTGDLAALLGDDQIDWDAVRATPKGRPSPLALLPAAT